MEFLDSIAGETTRIATLDAFVRLLAAVIVGGAVGFDRELRNKPAGLRESQRKQPESRREESD